MDITSIPFNTFIGIKRSEKQGYIFEVEDFPQYMNHLETVHASVQFALSEATSGQYLLGVFGESAVGYLVPVVRNVEIKYKKPAKGKLYSKAGMDEAEIDKARAAIESKGRALLDVNVQLQDSNGEVTMISTFTWFVQKLVS